MSRIICLVPVAPLRAEAAHRSEMVSQLLFGEFAEVLDRQKDFLQVRCAYDGYMGWVQAGQTVPVSEAFQAAAQKILCA
ncbi:MAG TPA: SH3 domain-containing protein, partial [Sediminibacterium sp.]|nr:SH3 domain-containing protein [Sediminibacterium sp.]